MTTVHSSRQRTANRADTETDKQPSASSKLYTAPVGGLLTNVPLSMGDAQTALVLDNFWPTTTGIEPRGGSVLKYTLSSSVEAFFQYRAGSNPTFFAADANNVYQFDESTPDGTALSAVISGQTGSDYSYLEAQNDGGTFLTIVNGEDDAQIYDGTSWSALAISSTPTVATSSFVHIWTYRNRTFFIEKATMNAWYLGINSVQGTAIRLPLAGVFNRGGSLLFGATWSSDSGAGMDDRCVFVTDQGEFAVYSGSDPSDPSDWQLNGVYDIGEPMGKNSLMRVGGDLVVATRTGLIPMSAATSKDPSQLKLSALSKNIDGDWRTAALISGFYSDWKIVKWNSRNMALVVPSGQAGDEPYCWAVNLETGAWSTFKGWAVQSIEVLADSLYFGDSNGNIYSADTGGYDNGQAFECKACFSFDHLGAAGAIKTAHAMKGTWRHNTDFVPKHTVSKDYSPSFGSAPSAAVIIDNGESNWDTSDWDLTFWGDGGSGSWNITEKWESISGHGETLAPQVQLVSAQDAKLGCELIGIDLIYSTGVVL